MVRLNTRVRKILMRIYGPVVEQELRQITNKEALRELCEDIDIITDTKKKIGMDWASGKNGS